MNSVNKQIIVGYLGKDPIVRYTPDDPKAALASFNVATSEYWKDKTSGEFVEETEWHRVVVFGRQVEYVQERLKQGSRVYVEGRTRSRKWMDKDSGIERTIKEIRCDNLMALDARSEGATKPALAQASRPAQVPQASNQRPQQAQRQPMLGDDPDIPF